MNISDQLKHTEIDLNKKTVYQSFLSTTSDSAVGTGPQYSGRLQPIRGEKIDKRTKPCSTP